MYKSTFALIVVLGPTAGIGAQQKRPVPVSEFGKWESLTTPARAGEWPQPRRRS